MVIRRMTMCLQSPSPVFSLPDTYLGLKELGRRLGICLEGREVDELLHSTLGTCLRHYAGALHVNIAK